MITILDPVHIGPSVVVLGMFDGVHLGHQALLAAGRQLADAAGVPLCVCTFEPHPLEVLMPEHAPKRLTLPQERTVCMAENNVDMLCVNTFSMTRANQEPEDFLEELYRVYQPVAVVCGFNFSFGRRGMGNPDMLQAYGTAQGFAVQIIPPVTLDAQPISSTRIRKALQDADMPTVHMLLGRPYTVSGMVVHGKHVGRTLGYPTANVQVSAMKALPRRGVYIGKAVTAQGTYTSVINIGCHPTLPEGPLSVEAHLLHVTLDLYDQEITLQLHQYLREEKQFASIQALQEQIAKDCQAAETTV